PARGGRVRDEAPVRPPRRARRRAGTRARRTADRRGTRGRLSRDAPRYDPAQDGSGRGALRTARLPGRSRVLRQPDPGRAIQGAGAVKKVRTALVAGGNRVLAYEVCRQLAARGRRVVLTARDAAD